ncbi:MAG TPA: hypothetical protein VGO62_18525 [Myxococcota bacterium]|jgi:hypothetical protein
MDRRAPDLIRETPTRIPDHDGKLILDGLRAKNPSALVLTIDARAATPGSAEAFAILGVLQDDENKRRVHEIVVFARGDGARDRAVDYLDGVVAELAKAGGYLPLDFEGRPYNGELVFVRGEVRDYLAEAEAARLLGEDPPKRGL